jgi:hypothetical protein
VPVRFAVSIFVAVVLGAVTAQAASAAEPAIESCSGPIHIPRTGERADRIRVAGMSCRHGKKIIRAIPENRNFDCDYTERRGGIGVNCEKGAGSTAKIVKYRTYG